MALHWRAALVATSVLVACGGRRSAEPGSQCPNAEHTAHGHAIATIEREGDAEVMLERVEDEDTRWVELPHFGECPYEEDAIPPFTAPDDAHVPGLDPKRSRLTNMDAGDAVIHNEALLGHLDRATAQVLHCISISACYDDRPLEPGTLDLKFELAPDGKVRGVDVDPTPGLDHTGIRPCARLAIWDTAFPAFDGADMVVTYELEID